MNKKSIAEGLLQLISVLGLISKASGAAMDVAMDDQQRAANGQFGSGGGSGGGGGNQKTERSKKIDASNDKIKEAFGAVKEAEREGVRGQAMIKLKNDLDRLKAQHKKLTSS